MKIQGDTISYILNENNILQLNRGAEVGVREAETSEPILENCPNLDLFLVDPYKEYLDFEWLWSQEMQDQVYETAQKRVARFQDRAKFLKMSSLQACNSELIPDESLDFVFIDADHKTKWALMDIAMWHVKIRPGGLLMGHDYAAAPGVKKAVHCIAQIFNVKPQHIPEPDIWLFGV